MDAHPNPAMPFPLGAMLMTLALIYGAFAMMGAWWLVYFNLRPVREAFARARLAAQTNGAQGLTP
jgi:hypothetical protein